MSSNSWNFKSPFLTIRCLYWRGRSDSWSANMSFNSRNFKSPFLTIRCLYWRGRSASWSANMSSNRRNLKSPFLTTRCLYWGVDLPVNQQIWTLTVEISSDHSWPLDASARVVDLTIDLPIWALTVEISNCHSWPLDASASGGWSASWSANISSNSRNLKSPFLTTRCLFWRRRSAIWSANMSYNSRNLKSPFLTIRCLYLGGDLLVDWPIWVLTIEISSHHSWLLDASTGG